MLTLLMPETWRDHAWARDDKVAYAHVDFLLSIANPDWKDTTDLPDGSIVDLDTLWVHMCDYGMQDPLVVRLNVQNRGIRLETGNQRIRLFSKYNVQYIPVVCQIADDVIGNPRNGVHIYPCPFAVKEKTLGYHNPLDILPPHVVRAIHPCG